MRCLNCGTEVMDGAKFCTECGAPMVQPFENADSNQWDFDRTAEQAGWETAQDAWSGQGFDVNGGYDGYQQQGWNQAPNQGYNQGYGPNQGYAPGYNKGYPPNQGYNQGYPPNQGYGGGQIGSKNKIAAGLLALLLGALGIHKFYLGYTSTGVIMLLVSVFTFGIGAIVMGIISIVEGIIYLTQSDYDFYQTYEANQKKWF